MVLKGVNITVEPGKITVLMGPNGSGKSSLAYTIMGHPDYRIERGSILLEGSTINNLSPDERSLRGIMLGFQNPIEVPGVKLSTLLIAAYNKRKGWKDLSDEGTTLFTLYTLPQSFYRYGNFGLKEHLNKTRQESPKYDGVMSFQESVGKCWWDSCAP